jgi:hypothetical protein
VLKKLPQIHLPDKRRCKRNREGAKIGRGNAKKNSGECSHDSQRSKNILRNFQKTVFPFNQN